MVVEGIPKKYRIFSIFVTDGKERFTRQALFGRRWGDAAEKERERERHESLSTPPLP